MKGGTAVRIIGKYVALVLVLHFLLLCGALPCSAAEEFPYSDLFRRAAETEEYDDGIGMELSDAFDDDPGGFIDLLSSEESMAKWRIIRYLVTAKGNALPELLNVLLQTKEQLGEPNRENLPQREIIGDLIVQIVYWMEPDCDALFSLAGHTDGAVTEALSYALGEAFAASPEHFVELLAGEDAQTQDEMVGFLVFDRYYRDKDNFCNTIETIRLSDGVTDGELEIIQMILAEVDRFYLMEHPPETEPTETETNPPETVPTTELPHTEPTTTEPSTVPTELTEPTDMPQEEMLPAGNSFDIWIGIVIIASVVMLVYMGIKRQK